MEEWTGDEIAGGAGSTAESQTGADRVGRGREEDEDEDEEEERGQTHPLEVLSGHPSSLDSILRHVVQQLDILTQSPISETSFPSGRDVVSNAAVSGGSGDEAINGGQGQKGMECKERGGEEEEYRQEDRRTHAY
ncbi:hypothetical protein EXN66_Car021840 [Channa argus]|uniref:Uncharacterized protein n=1 Tax=Channa argus TaxID=215402 RepID=A0A6G1QVA4_CHAAH|nr:hypothetical protein EXN66_Car021840 [Channa argus]